MNIKEELINNKIVLIDFYADWCGPCRMLAPIIEEIKNETAGKAKILKVDVDKNRDLAAQYNVMSIPTLVVVKEGKVTKQLTGFRTKKDILAALGV